MTSIVIQFMREVSPFLRACHMCWWKHSECYTYAHHVSFNYILHSSFFAHNIGTIKPFLVQNETLNSCK